MSKFTPEQQRQITEMATRSKDARGESLMHRNSSGSLSFSSSPSVLEIDWSDDKPLEDFRFEDGDNILRRALRLKDDTIATLLIQKGFTANFITPNDSSPLYLASQGGLLEAAKLLISSRADVNGGDKDGNSPLHEASRYNWLEVVELLISSKAEVNQRNAVGWTPLHEASRLGLLEVSSLLINSKAEVNLAGEMTGSPLLFAIRDKGLIPYHRNTSIKMETLLISRKADVNQVIKKGLNGGQSPLYVACKNRDTEAVRLLLEHDVNVNQVTEYYGTSPLLEIIGRHMYYIREKAQGFKTYSHRLNEDRCQVIERLLLDHDANVNQADKEGMSPLHFAIEGADSTLVKLLLSKGADVNAAAENEKTPFTYLFNLPPQYREEILKAFMTSMRPIENVSDKQAKEVMDLLKKCELLVPKCKIKAINPATQITIEALIDANATRAKIAEKQHSAAEPCINIAQQEDNIVSSTADLEAKANSEYLAGLIAPPAVENTESASAAAAAAAEPYVDSVNTTGEADHVDFS